MAHKLQKGHIFIPYDITLRPISWCYQNLVTAVLTCVHLCQAQFSYKYVRENVWGLYKIVPGVKLLFPPLLSLPLLHLQFPLRLFQYQSHFYYSCNKCYPCRSSYRTTENLFGICNDNFQWYFHSRGYIHLYCVVYIHLRLRREYIIETVNNL